MRSRKRELEFANSGFDIDSCQSGSRTVRRLTEDMHEVLEIVSVPFANTGQRIAPALFAVLKHVVECVRARTVGAD